jgi:hypothetical protein
MATTNAFDLLILPMLQCTAGILATFAMIRLVQMAWGLLRGAFRSNEVDPDWSAAALANPYRSAAPRTDRGHPRSLNLSR